MKKIVTLLLVLILLFGCAAKKEEFYSLKFNGQELVVGFDETVDETLPIEYGMTELKKKTVLGKVVLYLNDVDGHVYLNDYELNSIKDTCSAFSGEYIEKNGHACVIGKRIKKHDNYVVLYGDILSDNIDKVDRIEVYYE